MNMSCNETEKLAPLAVGEDLDAVPLAALREHVRGCPACADILNAAEAARAAYRSALPIPEPIDLWPGLRERLAVEARPVAEAPARPALRLVARAARATGVLAAAAALVFLARPWFQFGSGDAATAAATAAPEGEAVTGALASRSTAQGPVLDAPALAEVATPVPASGSAFPAEALAGVSPRPTDERSGGMLAPRTAPSPGGGLTRITRPTMGEELRQQPVQQARGGLILIGRPGDVGLSNTGAQAASGRTRRP